MVADVLEEHWASGAMVLTIVDTRIGHFDMCILKANISDIEK